MRVTIKGQVTVPKGLRQRFGIGPATEVEFHEERGKLVLVKRTSKGSPVARVRGRVKRIPAGRDVDEYLRQVRGSR
jgi:AbrB family looped-hinge helix DNA binding protein